MGDELVESGTAGALQPLKCRHCMAHLRARARAGTGRRTHRHLGRQAHMQTGTQAQAHRDTGTVACGRAHLLAHTHYVPHLWRRGSARAPSPRLADLEGSTRLGRSASCCRQTPSTAWRDRPCAAELRVRRARSTADAATRSSLPRSWFRRDYTYLDIHLLRWVKKKERYNPGSTGRNHARRRAAETATTTATATGMRGSSLAVVFTRRGG